MTLTLFNKLYKQYKECFDMELRLMKLGVTYEEAYNKAQKSEEWL